MRKILATTIATGALAAGGLATALPAQAADGVTANYGCNRAQFHNNTSKTVNVNYGTAGSGDVKSIKIGAKSHATVIMRHTSFGWTATHADGTEVGQLAFPGVDLTQQCTGKPSGGPTTQAGGGLAKTGF